MQKGKCKQTFMFKKADYKTEAKKIVCNFKQVEAAGGRKIQTKS